MSKYLASVVIKNSSAYLQHKGFFLLLYFVGVFFNLEYFKNTFGFLLLCRKLFHSTYFL